MTNAQRIILCLGLTVVIALSLRPPYQWEHSTYLVNRGSNVPHSVGARTENIGHRWIWDSPQGWEEVPSPTVRKSRVAVIDWRRLGVYVGVAVLVTLFATFVIFSSRKEAR